MESVAELFKRYFGREPKTVEKLPFAGSNRRYYRLTAVEGIPYIAVSGTSVEENRAFISLARHFEQKGLPVPRVLTVSDDQTTYLQEDLGDELLFDRLSESRKRGCYSDEDVRLLKKVISWLPKIQFEGADGLDFSCCYPIPAMDRRSVMWDLNYFKYSFLKSSVADFSEPLLEDDFERMADALLQDSVTTAFMYRDFQARNVMINEGEPYFIDFQGGRRGPCLYDLVSFVWQAKAAYPEWLKQELISTYCEALQPYIPITVEELKKRLPLFVLFRTLQVLGAYGFRGYFERKPHFLESIPFALASLSELLNRPEPFVAFPYLVPLLQQMIVEYDSRRQVLPEPSAEPSPLVVNVFSFSYKKGIPEDDTDNGGGFVFDCRALHNPGRYAEYKQLTGMDRPVIEFLEREAEVERFFEQAKALVEASVQRYVQRRFTSLMVSFGCTGGQHRSVYCAQRMADYLRLHYPIRVELCHREQTQQR